MLRQQLPLQHARPPQTGRLRSLFYRAIVIVGVLLAPLALIAGLLLRRSNAKSWDYKDRWRGTWAFALLFALGYIALAWFLQVYAFFWHALTYNAFHAFIALIELWGYHILFAPVFALALEGAQPQTRKVPIRTRKSHSPLQPLSLAEPDGQKETTPTPLAMDPTTPAVTIVQTVTDIAGDIIIGQALDGTLWQWVQAGRLTYPRAALLHHALLLGKTGSGKSKTAQRLAYGARGSYGMKVFCIDGKGDWDSAAEFKLVMRAAGATRIGVFPGDRHNGWHGTRQDIIARLMNCQRFSDDYYEGHTLNLLKYAFYLPGYDIPRNSQELIDRLYPPTLKALYKNTPEYAYFQSLRPDVFWGAYSRYSALFNAVGNGLDGEYGFGDWDCCYYLLDQKRLQRQSAIFAKLLLDDFELYVALRNTQPGPHPPLMLIIDDYSAFSDLVSIHDLLERLRSAGVSVIATAQGMRSLGPNEQEQERLLESAGVTILHSCVLPKHLVEVAGTRWVPELTHHIQPDENARGHVLDMPGHASIHMREETSIDPNDVQQLTTGEMFFAAGGLYQRTQVEMVPIADALITEQKQQLLALAEQEREHYEAEQAERLARPTPKTKKRTRQSNQSKPANAVPAAHKQTQPVELHPSPVSDGTQTPAPTSLEDLL